MSKKFGRNDNCPCQSGEKYKYCCLGDVDWDSIYQENDFESYAKNLSIRGKNIVFYERIIDALQIDNEEKLTVGKIKKACTPEAVRKIHTSVMRIWPSFDDLIRILKLEAEEMNGLYIGNYNPHAIERGIVRHSLYSNKILLVDPFINPKMYRKEYNPLVHPENFIETTLKNIRIWFTLMPWVYEGIVSFIRTPSDFNVKLVNAFNQKELKKLQDHPELKEELEKTDIPNDSSEEMKEYTMLSYPDSVLIERYIKRHPEVSDEEISAFLSHIEYRREEHPFFVEHLDEDMNQSREPLILFTAGANFEESKVIASFTNSYFITDIRFRWKEIEFDRESLATKPEYWSSFAKAFHNIDPKNPK